MKTNAIYLICFQIYFQVTFQNSNDNYSQFLKFINIRDSNRKCRTAVKNMRAKNKNNKHNNREYV